MFSHLVQSSADAIIMFLPNRTVKFLNPAATNLVGFTTRDAFGHHPRELWMSDNSAAHYDRDMTVVAAGQFVEPYEALWCHKDGTPVEVSVAVSAIRDSSGTLIGMSQIARDVRLQHYTQRHLWDMQVRLIKLACLRRTERLLSGVAHELNQPLAVISLLADAIQGDATAIKHAHRIIDQVTRANAIVKRAREGQIPERQPTDINGLVRDAVDLVVMAMDVDNVEINIALDKNLGVVLVDSGQIEQVLVNLIRNAIEAMQQQPAGRLTVTGHLDGDQLSITVADDGPGISGMISDRLFEPYMTTKPNGLGIGLSISREIVQAHGGELSVRQDQGHGACFTITLPLASTGA